MFALLLYLAAPVAMHVFAVLVRSFTVVNALLVLMMVMRLYRSHRRLNE